MKPSIQLKTEWKKHCANYSKDIGQASFDMHKPPRACLNSRTKYTWKTKSNVYTLYKEIPVQKRKNDKWLLTSGEQPQFRPMEKL